MVTTIPRVVPPPPLSGDQRVGIRLLSRAPLCPVLGTDLSGALVEKGIFRVTALFHVGAYNTPLAGLGLVAEHP